MTVIKSLRKRRGGKGKRMYEQAEQPRADGEGPRGRFDSLTGSLWGTSSQFTVQRHQRAPRNTASPREDQG